MTQQIIGGKFIADYPDVTTGELKPAVGYKLHTYVSSSTTNQATYTDAGLLAANTNPVTLDARGEASVFLTPGVAYTLVLKTPTGSTVWTQDGIISAVSPSDLSGSTGAGMLGFLYAAVYGAGTVGKWLQDLATSAGAGFIGFLQSGASAVLQTIQEKFRSGPPTLWDFLSAAKRVQLLAGTQIDVTVELQALIDSFTTYGTAIIGRGNYIITSTIYLKRNGIRLIGEGIGNTFVEFVNLAGGTAFAGHASGGANVITDCELSGFAISSSSAPTGCSIGVDITTMSYSRIDLSIQTRRVNGICVYGQGNSGSSPYYNEISGYWFGGVDVTQRGLVFEAGTWAGGSNGPNANIVGPIGRAASLLGVFDLVSGTDTMFNNINAESLGDFCFRINNVASFEETGTSSGANTPVLFKDTSKAFTVNAYIGRGLAITGGTGAGQVRTVKNNSGTQFTITVPWAVIPDATSTYTLSKNQSGGHKINNVRVEGTSTNNPDFIIAFPGTQKCKVTGANIQSLGSGLYVRDNSGSTDNSWYEGAKAIIPFVFTTPGASATVQAYPRNSVFGGLAPTEYVVEWITLAASQASPGGTATLTLDVGGTNIATGSDLSMTANLTATTDHATALAPQTGKITRDGTNRHCFLALQTGVGVGAGVSFTALICLTIV